MQAQSLTRAELVGRGFCSDVYAWGDGRVLKLFHGGISPADAQREYTATRAVHTAGLPAPAVFEIVEVESRHGIVFERIEGASLYEYTLARPWTLFAAVRLLAELHARLHQCRAPAGLPTLKDRLAARIDATTDVPEAEKLHARRRLADLPDGTALCHGDFHPANVLMTARGPVVIDWSSASRGDPLGDVAYTARLIRTASLPPWAPAYAHLLLRCLRTAMHRSYLQRCLKLHHGTRRQIDAWELPLAVAARSWHVRALS
jgi:aminoglycoside phosphotransferase (APT) family kinase protein